MLRKLEVVLLPVGLLVPVEAESRVQDLVPVSAYAPPCILVPYAGPQGAARDRDRGEPLLVERQADAVLVVLAVAIRLHRRAARAVVAEDAGGHLSGSRPDGGTVETHKADQPELRAALDGRPADQLRFRAATVADGDWNVDSVWVSWLGVLGEGRCPRPLRYALEVSSLEFEPPDRARRYAGDAATTRPTSAACRHGWLVP